MAPLFWNCSSTQWRKIPLLLSFCSVSALSCLCHHDNRVAWGSERERLEKRRGVRWEKSALSELYEFLFNPQTRTRGLCLELSICTTELTSGFLYVLISGQEIQEGNRKESSLPIQYTSQSSALPSFACYHLLSESSNNYSHVFFQLL